MANADEVAVHKDFGDWYRLVEIEPRGELLALRWRGAVDVAKRTNRATVINLVRQASGKPVSDTKFTDAFKASFQEHDTAFPMSDNTLELAVLSCATLAVVMERRDEASDLAALALVTRAVMSSKAPRLTERFEAIAREYLTSRGVEVRRLDSWPPLKISTPQLDELEKTFIGHLQSNQAPAAGAAFSPLFDKAVTWIKRIAEVVRNSDEHAEQAWTVQREQNEVAWWVLGQYSRDHNVPISSLDPARAVLVVAKELADLTLVLPGPVAARAVLDRVLRLVKESKHKASIKDAVNACDRAEREAWIGSVGRVGVAEFLPLHIAVVKSLETEGPEEWLAAFKRTVGRDAAKSESAISIAEQFYCERLLLKAAESVE